MWILIFKSFSLKTHKVFINYLKLEITLSQQCKNSIKKVNNVLMMIRLFI